MRLQSGSTRASNAVKPEGASSPVVSVLNSKWEAASSTAAGAGTASAGGADEDAVGGETLRVREEAVLV